MMYATLSYGGTLELIQTYVKKAKTLQLGHSEVVVAVVLFVVYSATSLIRFAHFGSGIDLGLFGQEVRRYASGQMPWSYLKAAGGFNLLGDHFSPVVSLLAPVYWAWSDVRVLLLAQAALIAVTAIVVIRDARTVIGARGAWMVGLAFGLSWAVASMALFDFHEVAFALPLLSLSLLMARREQWGKAVAWAAPLMLVKEDSVFLLLGLAIVLFLARRRRLAVALAAYALVSLWLITTVIIPRLSFTGRYTYWGMTGAKNSSLASVTGLVRQLLHAAASGMPLVLCALLLGATLFLPLRSRLLLVAAPALLIRFASPNETYWSTKYHYNATLCVVAFFAAIDALSRSAPARPDDNRLFDLRRHAGAFMLAVAVVIGSAFPLADYVKPSTYECRRCTAALSVLAEIPPGNSVTASAYLVDHLVDRNDVHLLEPNFVDSNGTKFDTDWVVIDFRPGAPEAELAANLSTLGVLQTHRYLPVRSEDGYVLLRFDPQGSYQFQQQHGIVACASDVISAAICGG